MKTMKHRCVLNKIAVQADEMKKSQIIYTDPNLEETATSGTVVGIGPDVKSIIIGDRIAFSRHAGIVMKSPWDGISYRVMPEEQVQLIIDNEQIEIIEHTDK